MTEIFINNVVVDLSKDMAMSLNFAIADILEPDKRNTSFSKTLKVPGTKTNNKLFSHIFEIDKEIISNDVLANFTPDFNPNLKASCKIFQENLLQFSGIVQLVQINRNKEFYEYEIVVYGALKNLITAFEGKKLEDIDLSKYDHTFNHARMKESWDTKIQRNQVDYVNFILGNPTGEGYVYPTIDYGYTQSPMTINLINSYPAVYVREYLVNMFKNSDFTWSSTFLDSDFFKKLIIPYTKSLPKLSAIDITNRSFKASTSISRFYNAPTGAINILNNRIAFDNDSTGGNYDTTNQFNNGLGVIPAFPVNDTSDTAVFTVLKKGDYDLIFDIKLTLEFFNVATIIPKVDLGEIIVKVVRMDSSGVIVPLTASGTITGSGDVQELISVIVYDTLQVITGESLNKGDRLFIKVIINRLGAVLPNTDSKVTIDTASYFSAVAKSIPVLIGDTMPLNSAIPKDIEQKDFFTSIIKMFNLYVQPDPDNDANLLIETLVDFYDGNSVNDWTAKVDYGKEILIKPISAIEGKDYIFKYKPDQDFYNKDYRETYFKEYGQKNITIPNDFLKGQKVFELIFSPTPSFGIVQNEMVIPRIVEQTNNGGVIPYKGNIRILIYGGVLSAGGSWSWKSVTSFAFTETTYAYAGHLDHPFTPTLDLLFDIPDSIYWGAPSNIGQNYTNNNLYNKYYRQFIEEITDRNSKIITASLRLRPIDVFALDFKNFIHIDGINYRLNKIIDYNPNSEGICKVELQKIKKGFTFDPYNEDIIGGTAQDPLNFDLVEGSEDEVRSVSAYSFIQLIDGSKDTVIGISGLAVPILNGGKD